MEREDVEVKNSQCATSSSMLVENKKYMSSDLYRIVLLTFLLHVSASHAQNDDKSNFERIFWQELNEEEKNEPLIKEQFSMGISELPQWFWNLPVATDKLSYAIGISDPEMEDSVKAQQQAVQRALLQLSLMNGASISGVSDLYSKDLQNKYEEYYKIAGISFVQGGIVVLDSFKTRFGEKMVLLKLDRNGKKQFRIETGIEDYKSNTKIEIGWCSSEKISYFARTDSDTMRCVCEQDNEQYNLLSVWNRDTISIPAYRYEYKGMHTDNPTDVSDSIIKLYHKGLWSGYFQAFLNGLITTTANHQSRLKAMTELHTHSSRNENLNSINRNIVNSNIAFNIRTIGALYGQLNIELYMSSK